MALFAEPIALEEAQAMGGEVARVRPGSVAWALGIRPGDRILAINDHPLRDLIDYKFYGADEEVEVAVLHRSGELVIYEVEKEYGEDLGVEFALPTFDGIRRCVNRCPFCFLKGNPKGMRRTLYIKDDDYRYSFLFGTFVTLTNLTEEDWQRIFEQRLTPLYVSVHATDPELRRRLLGMREAPDVLAQIDRLAAGGIQVHTQLVLVPGVNDGEALDRSIADLSARWPAVRTISVVPVGLTQRHLAGRVQGGCRGAAGVPLRPFTPTEMAAVLDQVEPWRRRFRRERGLSYVYPSDEFYLVAGRPLPRADRYDGFPQLENGVGIVRRWHDAWMGGLARLPRRLPRRRRVTLASGTLIAPTLARWLARLQARLEGLEAQLIPVENRLFGPLVTVSGLLGGRDVVEALRAAGDLGDRVFLPRVMLDRSGERTLDDWTPREIREALGVPVTFVEHPRELFQALLAA